jgi:hypothetical protein
MLVLSRAVVNFYHFTANVASNVTLHAQLYGSRLLAVQIALNKLARRTCCAAREARFRLPLNLRGGGGGGVGGFNIKPS